MLAVINFVHHFTDSRAIHDPKGCSTLEERSAGYWRVKPHSAPSDE